LEDKKVYARSMHELGEQLNFGLAQEVLAMQESETVSKQYYTDDSDAENDKYGMANGMDV
jgi:hypothetical protein